MCPYHYLYTLSGISRRNDNRYLTDFTTEYYFYLRGYLKVKVFGHSLKYLKVLEVDIRPAIARIYIYAARNTIVCVLLIIRVMNNCLDMPVYV